MQLTTTEKVMAARTKSVGPLEPAKTQEQQVEEIQGHPAISKDKSIMVRAIVEATLERLPLGKALEKEDSNAQFFRLLVNLFFDLLKSSFQRALSSRTTLEFMKPTLKNQIVLIGSMGRRVWQRISRASWDIWNPG